MTPNHNPKCFSEPHPSIPEDWHVCYDEEYVRTQAPVYGIYFLLSQENRWTHTHNHAFIYQVRRVGSAFIKDGRVAVPVPSEGEFWDEIRRDLQELEAELDA